MVVTPPVTLPGCADFGSALRMLAVLWNQHRPSGMSGNTSRSAFQNASAPSSMVSTGPRMPRRARSRSSFPPDVHVDPVRACFNPPTARADQMHLEQCRRCATQTIEPARRSRGGPSSATARVATSASAFCTSLPPSARLRDPGRQDQARTGLVRPGRDPRTLGCGPASRRPQRPS